MSVIDDLVSHLARHHWEPIDLVRDDDRLALYPLHGKIGVGFTLWKREPSRGWVVVVNGHWEATVSGNSLGGQTVAKFGTPLNLSPAVRRRIQRLLREDRR